MSTYSKLVAKIFRRTLLTLVCTYLIICSCLWAFSPLLARQIINNSLEAQGLALTPQSSIRFNPFLTRLSVRDLVLLEQADDPQQSPAQDAPRIRLQQLSIELSLFQLSQKQLVINELNLQGLHVDIHKDGDKVEISGLALGPSHESAEETLPLETPADKFYQSLKVLVPELNLRNVNVSLNIDGSQHQILIEHWQIENLNAQSLSEALELQLLTTLDATIDKAAISLSGALTHQGDKSTVDTQLSLKHVDLEGLSAYLPKDLSTLQGQMSLQAQAKVLLDKDRYQLEFDTLASDLKHLQVQYQDYDLALARQQVRASGLELIIDQYALQHYETELSINSQELHLGQHQGESQNTIISWGSLAFENAQVSSQTAESSSSDSALSLEPQVLIPALALENLRLSALDAKSKTALLSVNAANSENIQASPKALSLATLELSELEANLHLDQHGKLATLIDLFQAAENSAEQKPESSQSKEETSAAELAHEAIHQAQQDAEAEPNNFALAFEQVRIKGDSLIHIIDERIQPAHRRHITLESLVAGPFDTQQVDQKTQFEVQARSNEYARLDFQGNVTPLSEKLNLQLEGRVKELSLPSLSGYMASAFGYELKSGQLDSDISLNIVQSKIEGNTLLHLRGIEMSSADNFEEATLKDSTAIPLNLAISYLKDDKGNIRLKIPVSGDTSDPDFGYGLGSLTRIVTKKALTSAAESYLLKTFVPYANVVSVAMSAGKFILKVRFEALEYEATQTDLAEAQQAYMEQFIQLMNDKKKLQVKVCPVATPADIGLENGKKITELEILEQLNAVSLARAKSFKDYAISEGNIASNRMLLCAPQIDFSAKAQSRIKVSI